MAAILLFIMTRYHAYLEVDADGTCMAHVPDLAGCMAGGASEAAAVAALPAAIRAYLAWCAAHGEPVPGNGEIEVQVVEVARGCGPWRRGGPNALFSVDRVPLGDGELRTYLRRMSYSRGDLLALVRDRAGTAHTDPATGNSPPIDDVIEHVAATELWYMSRLGQRIVTNPDDDIITRLIDGRARAVAAILRLSPRQRDLVYVPREAPSTDPEEGWTLRKVLRRVLEHELEHTRQLQHALRLG